MRTPAMPSTDLSMIDIPFESLVAALPRPEMACVGPRLVIGQRPPVFVEPTLKPDEHMRDCAFDAEILFIVAYAAVGKTTMAHFLSGSLGIPLLDLARVPVSTGTLKALLLDIRDVSSPMEVFHAGRLPILIDALDEGRLLSGELGIESFLTTTAELILENRSVTARPKLVFFGRHESVEIAQVCLQLAQQPPTTRRLEVRFFDRDSAIDLIHAYAKCNADESSAYHTHPIPVRDAIHAYFVAIESALGLDNGQLWLSREGRAFAGYAPVLAALGRILAELTNYTDLTDQLKSRRGTDAWHVIETVIEEILLREQKKVQEALAPGIKSDLPDEVYDIEEQLTLINQYVHNQVLSGSNRVRLEGADLTKYRDAVTMRIPDHPFVLVGHQEFSNAVLGSVVMAHAITIDALRSVDLWQLVNLSRQPFLYRAYVAELPKDALIDGMYVGYILNSYWSDPVRSSDKISIKSRGDREAVVITIPSESGQSVSFDAIMPITAYAQLRDCEIDIEGEMKLTGGGRGNGARTFQMTGNVCLRCVTLDIEANSVAMDGDIWLEAAEVNAPAQLSLKCSTTSKVGFGAKIGGQFPWREVRQSLPSPFGGGKPDVLNVMLSECARRVRSNKLILEDDFSPTEGELRMDWVQHSQGDFRMLIHLMIKHGLATAEALGTAGKKKRVSLEIDWLDLLRAVADPTGVRDLQERFPHLEEFIFEARKEIVL